ncbi:MAG TPA: ABC transporter ATP-binding protein [Pseudomonadales bacterium]|nr:ABC transporter ATP-binding protein [Pseudomonadales bacterium]
MPELLRTRALSKRVSVSEGEIDILSDISLRVEHGDSVAIVGRSGSGKSTLLSLLAGLDTPSAGEIWFKNHAFHTANEDERARLRLNQVGFVFQSFQLIPSLTAIENVLLPLELSSQKHAQQRAQEWLARVGLAHRMQHKPKQLSGGEQQRVAIARAFVTEPDVIFADEPTGNLDSKTASAIMDLLFECNRDKRTTLILVTHDEKLAQRCNKSLLLEEGRLIRESSRDVMTKD